MALFQPSHVVPSTLSGLGNGVVSVASKVSISWQVNGNSAMSAFRINIYTNDAASELVHSTGIIMNGYGLPFYGTDSKGNQQTFVYEPSVTWSSLGLSDGGSYKLKITQYWNGTSKSVVQYSESAFLTRSVPTIALTNFAQTLSTVSNTFTASYNQSQGDSINWVRWQLQNVTGGVEVEIDDTGAINTAILEYAYDGFLTGNTYRIMVTVETQNGVVASSGWNIFDVSYPEAMTVGGIDLQYDSENECALLSWQKGSNIPGTASTENGISLSATGEQISIPKGTTVTWDTVDGESMNFAPEYSAYWCGKVYPFLTMFDYLNKDTYAEYNVTCSALSHDGAKLYIGADDGDGGSILIFNRSSLGQFVLRNTIKELAPIYTISCSPSGDTFVVGGKNYAALYDAATLKLLTLLLSSYNGTICTSAYSPSGDFFILGGSHGGYAEIHLINGTEYLGWENITEGGALDGRVTSCAFVDGGNILLLGGEFTSYCKAYSVSGTTLTFLGDLTTDGNTKLNGSVTAIAAAGDDGKKFVVCGTFTGKSLIYTVADGVIEKTMSISFDGTAFAAAWSPSGDILVFAGEIGAGPGRAAYMYYIENGISHLMPQIANGLSTVTPLSAKGNTCLFLADGKTLLIGGNFLKGAVFYSINDTVFDPVSFGDDLTVTYKYGLVLINANGNEVKIEATPNSDLSKALIGFFPGGVIVYYLRSDGTLIGFTRREIPYVQPAVTSVVLNGPQANNFVYIVNGHFEFSGTYTPARDFSTLFLTDYTSSELQAGTIAGSTANNALFRLSDGDLSLSPVYSLPTSVNRIRDFGIKSNTRYYWEMFYVTAGNQYSAPIASDTLCKQFSAFTLIEATEDIKYPTVYHALRVWRFANNVTGWNVSNNNTPSMLQNFTRYPFRQPSTQSYKSGILQGLLSNVKNGVYYDNAKQMELLFSISQSLNTFFLRDTKGNLYMVHTNGAITQSMSTRSARNEITISVPWAEIGDASNVSIIQTPEDEGWENNEVLNVSVYVDAQKGTANAIYPEEYTGTTFSANNFDLLASTPTAMEQSDLEVADGDLNVTV